MKNEITLKDIAEAIGVSVTTVSKALNNHPDISKKRKAEIKEYAKKHNYIPNEMAKYFRKKKSKLIGIVLPDNANPYNARIIKGIESGLYEAGYHCIIMNNNENIEKEMEIVRMLRSLNVAGVLIAPAKGNKEGCNYLKDAGIPYVLINRYLGRDQDAYVVIDDEYATYNATEYLATYQNKIFFLNYLPEISSSKNKLKGYKRALKDNNMTFSNEYVFESCLGQADGYSTTAQILQHYSPPFSILCHSDYVAIGVLCALQERGYQTPADVAVMGNGDIDILSFVKPRLSTVAVPKYRLGYKGAEILLNLIKQKSSKQYLDTKFLKTQQIVMNTEIIIRETS